MQFRSDHMLPASAHLRPGTIALLSVVLLTVASIPIATHQLPPLSDYVNHLARTHVIDAIGTDSNLSRYYVVEWQIIPNLMIDLIVPVLHRFMSVYLAGQIFTIAAFALIASGTLVFSRALNGRWSPLPLVALPLLYNGVLLVGVMNYVFGIGSRFGRWRPGSRCGNAPGLGGSECRPPSHLCCSFAICLRLACTASAWWRSNCIACGCSEMSPGHRASPSLLQPAFLSCRSSDSLSPVQPGIPPAHRRFGS